MIPHTNASNLNTITNAHTANPSTNAPAAAPSGVILSSDIPGKFVVRKRNTSSFPSSVNRFIAFSSINHHGEFSSSFVVFRQNRQRADTETSRCALLCARDADKCFENEDICVLNEKRSASDEAFCSQKRALISPRALDDDDDDARTPERLRAKDDDEEGRCCPRSRKRGIEVSVDMLIKTRVSYEKRARKE